MHCSGIHGVEGFAGSAIQLRALDGLQPVGADEAIVFVHILNPFGMAWLRRFNEHNVDLSRNWLEGGGARTGAPRVYRLVSRFLNPSVIRPWDLFYLKAILLILRYGFGPLRQAIAGGQYEDPQGLFYGGSRLEEGPAKFKAWLNDNRSTVRRLFVIDVHTGLGRWRQNSLFFPVRSVEDDALPDDIRAGLIQDFTRSAIGYEVRGGYPRSTSSCSEVCGSTASPRNSGRIPESKCSRRSEPRIATTIMATATSPIRSRWT